MTAKIVTANPSTILARDPAATSPDLRGEAAYLSTVCEHYRRRFEEAAEEAAGPDDPAKVAHSLRLCVEAVGVLMDSSRRFAAAVDDAGPSVKFRDAA